MRIFIAFREEMLKAKCESRSNLTKKDVSSECLQNSVYWMTLRRVVAFDFMVLQLPYCISIIMIVLFRWFKAYNII